MHNIQHFIILGGGGFGRETAHHLLDIHPNAQLVFVDESSKNSVLKIGEREFPVMNDWSALKKVPNAKFIVGVGIPATKKIMVKKALEFNLTPAPTQIHPLARVQDAKVGVGGLICPGVVVTCNVQIGDYVVLNLNATVGHDSILGDYVTCNPSACISGFTTLSEGVLFGVGAATKEGVSIAANCTVGGKAFVNKDVNEEGLTLVGVPAVALKKK